MEQQKANKGAKLRKWLRITHRELSYVFAGMLLVYAVSGIALNHKNSFNSQYSVSRTEFRFAPAVQNDVNQAQINEWLAACGVSGREIQHYFPDAATLKVFLKGNSNLVVDLSTGKAVLEQVHKRPILGSLSKLHYNPGKAWTWFSDIFAVSLIVIVLSGLFMLRGKHSLLGIGGVEFLIGILIPLLFILFS
ncbi:MAG TPA: peptidase [Bacteroidales bacterium]|nr:peptidase [Bacteroidales bacterium]